MNSLNFILVLSVIGINIVLYNMIQYPLINICETEKCPYCYGTDFCKKFKQNELQLKKAAISDLFANYLSVKNVFYAVYKNSSVILKKLAHNCELNKLDALICINNNLSSDCDLTQFSEKIEEETNSFRFFSFSGSNLKICPSNAEFISDFFHLHRSTFSTNTTTNEQYAKQIWTILQLSAEPLIIKLLRFENGWPIPRYLGACGRVIVEEDSGFNLNNFAYMDWSIRANLTLQLLQAARDFTEKHPDFRFYLTDVSPDNIVVNSELRLRFIDLENIIMVSKRQSGAKVHHSIEIDAKEDFAYSEDEICKSSISDHNYYAVCKLLLSKRAPWPMMNGGLLHSPPDSILKFFPDLFNLIELCARPSGKMDRFIVANKISSVLEEILLQ